MKVNVNKSDSKVISNISEESAAYIFRTERTGIFGERPGRSPRGLHKTEMESIDSIETFASVKSRKISLYL